MWAQGTAPDKMIEYFEGGFIGNMSSIKKAGKELKTAHIRWQLKENFEDATLRIWQAHLDARLDMAVDDRKIYWYYEEEGNTGKGWMATYLAVMRNAAVYRNGKSADIKYAYNGEEVVVFDFVCTQEEHINYSVIEEIKNGRFLSTKYESKLKLFPSQHVICFASHLPRESALSADRWHIQKIGKNLQPRGNHARLTINEITVEENMNEAQLEALSQLRNAMEEARREARLAQGLTEPDSEELFDM